MDCIVHRVAKSWARQSDFDFDFSEPQFLLLYKGHQFVAMVK